MLTGEEIRQLLSTTDEDRLSGLFAAARQVRGGGNCGVFLRGLVEIGSYCRRGCAYCGLRAPRNDIRRYRLTFDQIAAAAKRVRACEIGTIVLQSGEDFQLSASFISEVVSYLNHDLGLAVTLSLGERTPEELSAWRRAGAVRYLMRFETSNEKLFQKVHPPVGAGGPGRLALLGIMRDLGYEVGSGFMVGLPGQNYDDLLQDILLCQKLDLDMIGLGPYLPHPATPLYKSGEPVKGQVPASGEMTKRVLAILASLMPTVNIPSTTALATAAGGGGRAYLEGLLAGANVVMPDFTPDEVRHNYEIYPGKAAFLSAEELVNDLKSVLAAAGRPVVTGAGPSRHYLTRIGHPL